MTYEALISWGYLVRPLYVLCLSMLSEPLILMDKRKKISLQFGQYLTVCLRVIWQAAVREEATMA